MTACHISRTLASIDASFVTALLAQYGLCCESILLCGNEEQKVRLPPSLARLKTTGCFCLTEPQSGSDASDLRTVATKVPGGYQISGSKRWIGNGLTSEVFIVWAKNANLPGAPVMGFIVQRSQQSDPRAIKTTKIEGKISLRMVQNANVGFRNAYCPDANAMSDCGKYKKKECEVHIAMSLTTHWLEQSVLERRWQGFSKHHVCPWHGFLWEFARRPWKRL